MGWGDEIMAAGQARELRARDPGRRRVRILDRYNRARSHAAWQGNPHIAAAAERGDFVKLLNGGGVRPYIEAKHAQRWVWKDWPGGKGPPRGELYLSDEENTIGRQFAGRIVLEPHIKPGASPNKAWGWMRWNKLAWLLQERYGQRVTQLGSAAVPLLAGAELVETKSFREAAAVLAGARAAVLPEGGLHHAAAALNLPAVVIFGGFIAPRHTGYDGHVNLFTGGEACGMRVPCDHCRDAMAKISPEDVAEQLMELLRVPTSRHLAA